MSDFNAEYNRAVWFDIPVADLERSAAFYRAVLGIEVSIESYAGCTFALLEHDKGNGGCLVENSDGAGAVKGILVYMNVDGRIREAVQRVDELGGVVVEDVHAIGPHGFRAVVHDSEGNRIALHSTLDR